MSGKNKVLLLGIDGGTFRIIEPGIKSGRLPTLKRLLNQGVSGILKSTIPPATIPAFPTLMTGKNPGKHGVFGFIGGTEANAAISDATKMVGRTLWRILSDFDRACVTINFPLTYPPEPINGVIITGMLTPLGKGFSHPPELTEKINEMTAGYPIRFDPELVKEEPKKIVEKVHEVIEKRRIAVFHLLENWNWDLFAVLFNASDFIQHILWRSEADVLSIYAHIDEILGNIINRFPEAHVFIFSDHGAGPYEKLFNLNLYLKSLDLLKIKQIPSTQIEEKIQPKTSLTQSLLKKIGLTRSNIRNRVPARILALFRKFTDTSLSQYIPQENAQVNIGESKAYYLKRVVAETPCIQINQPDSQKYRILVSKLTKQLLELVDPETKKPIVKAIYRREEIYHGPFVDKAPDLLLLLQEGYKASASLSGTKIVERLPKPKGTHTEDGIFIAMGPFIEQSKRVSETHLEDLLPTILHLMDLPIPDDADGNVKQEIFIPDSPPAKRKPKFFKAQITSAQTQRMTEDEEEEVKDRLRSLGYLD